MAIFSKNGRIFQIADKFKFEVWDRDLAEARPLQRLLLKSIRVACQVGRDLWDGQLTLRAMSLVYTTLLSLIPLLAVSFSVLKGFGVHREIEPFLITYLAPFGQRADEIARQLVAFVDNTNVSVLGYLGFALLFYAIVSLLQKIEKAFNYVWRVAKHRSLAVRIRDYLVLLIIGPTLMFVATGIWASIIATDIMEQIAQLQPFGWLLHAITQLLPVFLVIVAFSFIYAFVPYVAVRWRAAITGGVVAGVMWNIGGVSFAVFVGSSANYPAIYSGFATAIFFIIWLYIAWMIVLVGASISFYVQNPSEMSQSSASSAISNALKEKIALVIAAAIGRRFYSDKEPLTSLNLRERLHMPASVIDHVLTALVNGGILLRAGNGATTYVPAHAWENVSVADLMHCVRNFGDGPDVAAAELQDQSINDIWESINSDRTARAVSLKDLSLGDSRI